MAKEHRPATNLLRSFKYQFHSDNNCGHWFVSFDYEPVYTINNASLPNQQNDPSLPPGTNHVSRQLIAAMYYVRKVALKVNVAIFLKGPRQRSSEYPPS